MQDELAVAEFRRRMIAHLVERLGGDTSKAQAIEAFLFHLTPVESLQIVFEGDHRTALNHALIQLFIALVDRHIRQRQLQHDAATIERHLALRHALGGRFEEAMALLRSINMVKLHAASECADPFASHVSTNFWTINSSFIPTPAEQLFLHNALSTIAEAAPLEDLQDQDWDLLIREGQRDLQEYLEWVPRQGTLMGNYRLVDGNGGVSVDDDEVSRPPGIARI